MSKIEFSPFFRLTTILLLWGASPAIINAVENPSPAPIGAEIQSAAKPSAVHDILVQAIGERRLITFTYRGHLRVVEPHAYGCNAKGDAILLAFQIEGSSASRPPPGWRTFSAGAIEALKLGDRSFAQARDGYSPNELRLSPLWAEVPALVIEE